MFSSTYIKKTLSHDRRIIKESSSILSTLSIILGNKATMHNEIILG